MSSELSWKDGAAMRLAIDGAGLEAACFGPPPDEADTIILLHEGLGCVALWRDFPRALVAATGHGVFAYSRQGYGGSDPCELPRPLDYMTREAVEVLPEVLDAVGFRRGTLLGHSDGASIAAIHAGTIADPRVRSLVLMAPHFFTEPMGLAAIAEARRAYEEGDLRRKLARYHTHVDVTFRGWNGAWLDPDFEHWNIREPLTYIRVPVLAIQGTRDQYGTTAQLDALEEDLPSPLDVALLEDCRHAPHIDQAERCLQLVRRHIERLSAFEGPHRETTEA